MKVKESNYKVDILFEFLVKILINKILVAKMSKYVRQIDKELNMY